MSDQQPPVTRRQLLDFRRLAGRLLEMGEAVRSEMQEPAVSLSPEDTDEEKLYALKRRTSDDDVAMLLALDDARFETAGEDSGSEGPEESGSGSQG